MKVLIDMNLSPDWREVFERAGIEAIHWSTAGDPKATDREILAWARQRNYLVFTHDLDFGRLLALTRASGPSVLQLRTEDNLPETLAPLVLRTLHDHGELLERGSLVVLEPTTARARILPIKG
jgi:predicted nuclease of predicted toxin-antitoxin system